MQILSIVVATLLVAALIVFIIMVGAAIVFNMKLGLRYRRNLARRLDQLRLSRMLTALGIDTTRYLHETAMVDVHRHMQRCSECEQTGDCDEALSKGVDPDTLDYCNNAEELRQLARRHGES